MRPALRYVLFSGGGGSSAALLNLRTRGRYVEYVDGTRMTVVGCTDFNLKNRFDTEGWAAVRPVVRQRADLRFNFHRVWTLFDIPGIGTYTTCDYGKIPELNSRCADTGTRLHLTAYTGINDPDHWNRLIDAALKCSPYPTLDYVNEFGVNQGKVDPQGRTMLADTNGTPYITGPGLGQVYHEQPPSVLLASHGSNGSQAWPVFPLWGIYTMHFNDAPQAARKTGHNTREVTGMTGDGGCGWADETTRCGDHYTDPQFAFYSAQGGSLLCGGTFFHSVLGKLSLEFEGDQLDCAKMWADGAWSVPLSCQGDDYVHRSDLEQPDAGSTGERAYQIGSSDSCIVHIPGNIG